MKDYGIYIYRPLFPSFSRMKNYPKGVNIPWMGNIKLMSVAQMGDEKT